MSEELSKIDKKEAELLNEELTVREAKILLIKEIQKNMQFNFPEEAKKYETILEMLDQRPPSFMNLDPDSFHRRVYNRG